MKLPAFYIMIRIELASVKSVNDIVKVTEPDLERVSKFYGQEI
jgi:hypothetical protein